MKLLTETVQWGGVNVEVQFTFTPGCPEQGPSYDSGGEPATAPEIEIERAWIVDDDGNHIGYLCPELRDAFDEYAYHELVASASEQLEPDPDHERERMREDRP